ncbi:MAG: hypothetical protein Q4C65_02530 [Eubacteriales bacterium]|nr:hypothetical protein [Eubacteriales bacterium]
MKKMSHKQIDELNELLTEHSETLTAFYDEGIQYGLKQGVIVGIICGSLVALGAGIATGLDKIRNSKKKEEES